jgi:hypothetical protein
MSAASDVLRAAPAQPPLQGGVLTALADEDGRVSAADLREYLRSSDLAALDIATTGPLVSRRWFPPGDPSPVDRPTRIAVVHEGPAQDGGRSQRAVLDSATDPQPPSHPLAGGAPGWRDMLPDVLAAVGGRALVVGEGTVAESLWDMVDDSLWLLAGEEGTRNWSRLAAALAGVRPDALLPAAGVIDTSALSRAVHGTMRARHPGSPRSNRLPDLAAHYGLPSPAAPGAVESAVCVLDVLAELVDDAARRGAVIDMQRETERYIARVRRWQDLHLDDQSPALGLVQPQPGLGR